MPHGTILIAIGANLPSPAGPPLVTCEAAVHSLAGLAGLTLAACSRWFRSPAYPPSTQPDYVNGAVRLRGSIDPHALLQALHAIEHEAGRHRSVPNAARTLDLDLLAIDDIVLETPTLTLPHPRLHTRAFVLAPLVDIAPSWRHPGLDRTPPELLAATDSTGLTVLGSHRPPETLAPRSTPP